MVHASSRPWTSASVKFGIRAILIRAKAVLNRAGTQAPTRGVAPVSLSFASLAASTKALYSSLAADLWEWIRHLRTKSLKQTSRTKRHPVSCHICVCLITNPRYHVNRLTSAGYHISAYDSLGPNIIPSLRKLFRDFRPDSTCAFRGKTRCASLLVKK